ncbi:SIR2 family protein [Actinomyces qiguomingii]|uniref:SIR2 family protein n=1 Tax=Actinomyces qiguomingii TaxID=2057800 RepID=UPI000CA026C6|nr:SIR2 family protein [Actinomyces qiguomingii]
MHPHLVTDAEYGDVIKEISSAEKVMIYCGAGVTYPLTGLGWNALVVDVANRLKSELQQLEYLKGDREFDNFVHQMAGNYQRPAENATLLSAYMTQLSDMLSGGIGFDSDRALRDAIRKAIYRRSTTSILQPYQALLPQYVAALIVTLLQKEVDVRVVTTNYDTFLERSLKELFNVLNEDEGYGKYRLLVRSNSGRKSLPSSAKGVVPMVYLHGRVPIKDDSRGRSGLRASSGKIVFSELDYYAQNKKTQKILKDFSDEVDCTIIVGSSLDDPPLLDWIQTNRDASSDNTVISVQSVRQEPYGQRTLDESNRKNWVEQRAMRFRSLGVEHYVPVRCYADVAVFLRDLVHGLLATTPGQSMFASESDLSKWGSALNINEAKVMSLHKSLAAQNELIASQLRILLPLGYNIETRTEYWLRAASPHDGDPFYMTKIADSSGPVLSSNHRRSESYLRRFPSRSAAMRIAQLDEPGLVTFKALGQKSSASRWQAYYGIPIHNAFGDFGIASQVTVGAVVVAIRLHEESHEFLDSDEREKFAEGVDEVSAKIAAGALSPEQVNANTKLIFLLKYAALEASRCIR